MASIFTNLDSNATITTAPRSIIDDTTTGVPLSKTAHGKFRVILDLSALAAGDDFSLLVYSKVDGGTQRVVATFPLVGTFVDLYVLPELWLYDAYDLVLVKNSGTDRAIRWAVINDARDEIPTAATIATAVLAATLEGAVTVGQGLRGLVRHIFGARRSGMDTGTVVVRDLANAKNSHTIVLDDPTDTASWTSVTLTDLD